MLFLHRFVQLGTVRGEGWESGSSWLWGGNQGDYESLSQERVLEAMFTKVGELHPRRLSGDLGHFLHRKDALSQQWAMDMICPIQAPDPWGPICCASKLCLHQLRDFLKGTFKVFKGKETIFDTSCSYNCSGTPAAMGANSWLACFCLSHILTT